MAALAVGAMAAIAGAARADQQIYSYDAVSPEARALAATGLSFVFERHPFGGLSIHRIIQTGERGSATLKAASDAALGPGGLRAALGGQPPAGRLYRIEPAGDGRAFIGSVCPGAEQAWLAIGPLRRFQDLKVQAVGKDAGAAAARPCSTLVLSFRNDWVLPQRPPPKARFPRNLP